MGNRVFTGLAFLLSAFAVGACAQGRAAEGRIIILDPGLSLGRASFLYPPTLGSELPFQNPSMVFPGDEFGIVPPFLGGVYQPRMNLISPLPPLLSKQEMSPLQIMLGAVQTGAVGYMAYRHIKKYGLFR
jgi:hypothetical protein